jgi:hypothetical protein
LWIIGSFSYVGEMLQNEQPSLVARAFRHHLMGSHGFLDFDSRYPRAPSGLKRADCFICSPRILIEQKDIRTKKLKSIGRKLEDILSESNRQLKDAQIISGWTDAEGVLLLINQIGGSLPFYLSFNTIRRRIRETRPNGELRFPNIDALLYVHHAEGYTIHQGRNCSCIAGSWGSSELETIVRAVGDTWSARQANLIRMTIHTNP